MGCRDALGTLLAGQLLRHGAPLCCEMRRTLLPARMSHACPRKPAQSRLHPPPRRTPITSPSRSVALLKRCMSVQAPVFTSLSTMMRLRQGDAGHVQVHVSDGWPHGEGNGHHTITPHRLLSNSAPTATPGLVLNLHILASPCAQKPGARSPKHQQPPPKESPQHTHLSSSSKRSALPLKQR